MVNDVPERGKICPALKKEGTDGNYIYSNINY
jgi:hypothetical protein